MTSEVKTEAGFGLSGPDYPQASILEAVSACSLNFRGRGLAVSMTSKAKTETGFGFSGFDTYWAQFSRLLMAPLYPIRP